MSRPGNPRPAPIPHKGLRLTRTVLSAQSDSTLRISHTSLRRAVGCMVWLKWSRQSLNPMGKLIADIIVETLQNTSDKHCCGAGQPPECRGEESRKWGG